MSERCHHCGKPINPETDAEFWADDAHRDPNDSERLYFHAACWDTVNDPDYQAWCEEQESLRGYSDEERERI